MTENQLESLRQETLQSVMAIVDVQATDVSIYLIIVFAYIIVAYIAGVQSHQVSIGHSNINFVAACLWELMMITTLGQGATEVGREMFQSADVQLILDNRLENGL